ncbi:DUF1697 domain-containing protein [Bdellovibrio bacteriovorus]
MNCKMPELKKALELAGFSDVETVLSSGNAVFTYRKTSESTLEKKIEKILKEELGTGFSTIVRSIDDLKKLIDDDHFKKFKLKPGMKPIVTFLKNNPQAKLDLPMEKDGARILKMKDRVIYSAYTPSPKGAVFMVLIEKTFGKDVTTRTLETIKKITRK